jgi:DNA-binding NarL/FixJ family response regulator
MGYRIVLADDHPLFRDALRLTLQDALGDVSFDEAGCLKEVVQLLSTTDDVDLVLLDLKMPGVQGFSGLVLVRAQFPLIPVVVVSGTDDSSVIVRALSLGAAGFIPKSTPVPAMHTAVSAVLEGGEWIPEGIDPDATVDREADEIARRMSTLTPQQMRVLMMLREGCSTSRSPMSCPFLKPPSRRTCRPYCKN